MNDYLLRIIGASRPDYEAGRHTCYDATPSEYRHLDDRAVEEARAHGFWEPFEKEYERPDGSRVPVRVSSAPMPHFLGHCVIAVEDLTAQREAARRVQALQAGVHHLSRLSAMGTMASIMAHEVAQPLSAVSNALSAATLLANRDDPASRMMMVQALQLASQQSERANAIIKRIRHFSAPDHEQWQSFDLRSLIGEAASLALLKCPGVELNVSVSAKARQSYGDPVQIEQVLVNLLRNAAEAMGERGRIEVAARRRRGMIEVSVLDDGPGFGDGAKGQAFEAFVTTKPEGTGLGLSVCRSIVEQHGGAIELVPSPSGGHVRFTFPGEPPQPTASANQRH